MKPPTRSPARGEPRKVISSATLTCALVIACASDDSADTLPLEELRCGEQTTKETCEDRVATLNGAPVLCRWIEWYPVEHDAAADTCAFGPPRGRCDTVNYAGDGCVTSEELESCNPPDTIALRREEGGQALLAKGQWCDPGDALGAEFCEVASFPECACLCDPNYPDGSRAETPTERPKATPTVAPPTP